MISLNFDLTFVRTGFSETFLLFFPHFLIGFVACVGVWCLHGLLSRVGSDDFNLVRVQLFKTAKSSKKHSFV